MRVAGRIHLTYCSNIHAGETWQEVSAALADALPRVRAAHGHAGPLGVGLRLSAEAASTLESPAVLQAFLDFLDAGDYYVLTINGFPYGAFHGQRVKERVYLPDWRQPARLDYTNRLARLMARFLAARPDDEGSVSTVPGAFAAHVESDADLAAIATGILRHAAYLVDLRARTGRTVTLALEPEPACCLETIDDAVGFFTGRLFDAATVAAVASETGVALSVDDVRRHVGICLDACHMAVEFERPAHSIERLAAAGIRICKVQLSSALELQPGVDARAKLQPFADDVYLHQVVQRRSDGTLVRYTDLPEALAADADRDRDDAEWRVHFHVPIFLSNLNGFGTTQPDLAALLELLKGGEICSCLEVETYTWDVLPAEYRRVDVATAIARELNWVRAILTA
jgi:hypothetical protein